MKLTKIWHPSEQNYLLFTSVRDSNISRGCAKILKFSGKSRGKGKKTPAERESKLKNPTPNSNPQLK